MLRTTTDTALTDTGLEHAVPTDMVPTDTVPTGRVSRVVDQATGAVAIVDGQYRVEFSHRADVALARRWASLGRRVSRVVIDADADVAHVHGIGHRLPFVRRIPMTIALGLAASGVPTRIAGGRPA